MITIYVNDQPNFVPGTIYMGKAAVVKDYHGQVVSQPVNILNADHTILDSGIVTAVYDDPATNTLKVHYSSALAAKKTKKLWVYISHPITHGDRNTNIRNAIKVADQLLALGYIPFCPALSCFWDLVSPKGYEAWLAYDFAILERMDVLLATEMEIKSTGREREIAHMCTLEKPVVYSIEELEKL